MKLILPGESFKPPDNYIFHLMSWNDFAFRETQGRFEYILLNKHWFNYKITELTVSLIVRILLRFSGRSKRRHWTKCLVVFINLD